MLVELTSLRATTGSSASGMIAQWRVGAIVEATAVRDVISGQLSLAVGSLRLPARIASGNTAGPANGEKLQLRVLRTSPVLALESLAVEPPTESSEETVNNALLVNVPRQSSPAPLLANLAWLTNSGTGAGSEPLPQAVTDAVQKLMQSLSATTDLADPEKLFAAVQRSGVFLESNLANASANQASALLDTDLKALLLGLKQTLTQAGAHPASVLKDGSIPAPLPSLRGTLLPLPGQPASLSVAETAQQKLDMLAQQTDGALARLTATQLVNAEAGARAAALLLEIPVQRDNRSELLRFRFSKGRAQYSNETTWSVDAALHLGIAGTLHAKVSLQGSRVSVQLRAESAPVVAALTARADDLANVLRGAGLSVDRVVCLHGLPPDEAAPSSSLLNVRA